MIKGKVLIFSQSTGYDEGYTQEVQRGAAASSPAEQKWCWGCENQGVWNEVALCVYLNNEIHCNQVQSVRQISGKRLAMVQAEFNGRVVHNGVKDSRPETSPFSLKAPQKDAGSDSSDEDKEGMLREINIIMIMYFLCQGQIRVGRDYQAVPPPCLPPSERTAHQGEERALLVWAPGVAGDAMEDKECRFLLLC